MGCPKKSWQDRTRQLLKMRVQDHADQRPLGVSVGLPLLAVTLST